MFDKWTFFINNLPLIIAIIAVISLLLWILPKIIFLILICIFIFLLFGGETLYDKIKNIFKRQ